MEVANFGRIMKTPLFLSYYYKLHCTEMFHEPVHVILCFHPLVKSAAIAWRHVSALPSDVEGIKFQW